MLEIHDDTLKEEGGLQGIRDLGLLESAVDMPRSMLKEEYLHQGLAAMAAAYLFHLCGNHAFIDGNKRAASFSCVLFLYLNGIPEDQLPPEEILEQVTLDVASGKMTKAEVTEWLNSLFPQHSSGQR